jgi:hypothetical protein
MKDQTSTAPILAPSHQAIVEQLDVMLRARYPLIYIVGAEEEPIEAVLFQVADYSSPLRDLYFWDIRAGAN